MKDLTEISNPELVLVIGLEASYKSSLCELIIDLGGKGILPEAIPDENANYVAFYKRALLPDVIITHLGIVDEIIRFDDDEETYAGVTIYLKAVIKLENYFAPKFPDRAYEKWNIQEFGLSKEFMSVIQHLHI